MPTLSVIMPNYNHGSYISDALTAIFDQSFQPSEIIVVDDGSSDDSASIVESLISLHTNLRLIKLGINKGVVAAVNRGLEEVSGDYVYMPASNDRVESGFFARAMGLLMRYPEAALCCTDFITFDDRESLYYLGVEEKFLSPQCVRDVLAKNEELRAGGANSIIRRTALRDAGFLLPGLRWHSDTFAVLVASVRHGMCYLPGAHINIRVDNKSFSRIGRRNSSEQKAVMTYALLLLESERYSDIRNVVIAARAWPLTDLQCFGVLISDPVLRQYISAGLAARTVRNALLSTAKRIVPLSIQRIVSSWLSRFRGRR